MPLTASGQYDITPVLVYDDNVSGELIRDLQRPSINATGVVAVVGTTDAPSATNGFLYVSPGFLLREGDPVAGAPAGWTYQSFDAAFADRPINASGTVAFSSSPGGSAPAGTTALHVGNSILFAEGDPAPGITGRAFEDFLNVAIANDGRVLFDANLDGATTDDRVVYFDGMPLSLTAVASAQIFRKGQAITSGPLAGNSWSSSVAFVNYALNNVGTVLFEAGLAVPTATFDDNETLIRKRVGFDYELLLRRGVTSIADPAAGGTSLMGRILQTSLNDANDWAIYGTLGGLGSGATDSVVIAGFGAGAPQVIAQEGDDVSALFGGLPGTLHARHDAWRGP